MGLIIAWDVHMSRCHVGPFHIWEEDAFILNFLLILLLFVARSKITLFSLILEVYKGYNERFPTNGKNSESKMSGITCGHEKLVKTTSFLNVLLLACQPNEQDWNQGELVIQILELQLQLQR
jgi:hypothetical protein